DLRRISSVRASEVSPKVNPKNGNDIVFVSGRTGKDQIWRMNLDGTGLEMLTDGSGYADNPAWSPDGTKIAFAWTRGFEIGSYNLFIMDIGSKNIVQLTHAGTGFHENPTWAPDGK